VNGETNDPRAESESLHRQLAEARENLRLIHERESEYVEKPPLDLVKEKRRTERRIEELEQRLGELGQVAPPASPDADTLPDPGLLPPGSRLPFRRNAIFTGRDEPLKTLARAFFPPDAAPPQSPPTLGGRLPSSPDLEGRVSPPPELGEGLGRRPVEATATTGEGAAILITQAIHGMGGVGKTQLAVEFAYRYGRFLHSVHWIDGAQPDAIGAEVALCGAEMNLPYWPAEQPEQIRYTLRQWQSGGPRLVILDNLEDVEATREWLLRLGGGPLRLLLTARRSDWPADLGLNPLRLDVFTPEESRAFLRRYLPETRAADADLAGLAERLGRLPLALELAGRYLERLPRLTVADYLARLADIWNHRSMRGWREEMGNPTGHDLDLLSTFALSWERVTDETARRLFLLAGHCAPNRPIPCELLERAAELDAETCDEAMSVLTGLGLLELDDPHAGPTIHPLLAEYARNLVSEPVLSDLASVLSPLTYQSHETGLPDCFTPLRPHVEQVAVAAEAAGLEDAGVLWNNLGGVLQALGDLAGAQGAFERALAIWQEVYGEEHPRVATGTNNLGSVLQAQGDLAGARAAYERALYILECSQLPPEHPNIKIVRRNLESLGS
jgi:tetratricopeptide (TPR) repeat protein